MRVYYYKPADLGMDKFPDLGLRLTGAEEVPPDQAEVFILPLHIHGLTREQIYALPYLKGNEERHVFWNVGDDGDLWFDLPSLFIRTDATKTMQQHDPNTVGLAWPAADLYRPHLVMPNGRFEYDVVFQGRTDDLTHRACESVRRSGLKAHLVEHPFFFGHHFDDPDYEHWKTSFVETLSASRLSLAPSSPKGYPRYRFYEAMSMGRVAVLLCDDGLLPFRNKINYDQVCLWPRESEVDYLGEMLAGYLKSTSDDYLVEMGKSARFIWQRHMNAAHWPDIFADIVKEHYHL